jgi:hypothetical protein
MRRCRAHVRKNQTVFTQQACHAVLSDSAGFSAGGTVCVFECIPHQRGNDGGNNVPKHGGFETSAGGFGYATATGILDIQNQQIVNPEDNIYKGEYLTIYYNGMAIVIGYFASGQTLD